MTANGKSLRVSSLPLSGNENRRRSKRKRFFIRLAALFFLAFFCMPCTVFAFAEEGGTARRSSTKTFSTRSISWIWRNCRNT